MTTCIRFVFVFSWHLNNGFTCEMDFAFVRIPSYIDNVKLKFSLRLTFWISFASRKTEM
jgi:hypothetical protein